MAKVLSRLDILLHANTANYVREMKKATDKTKKELKSVADYGKLVGSQLGVAFATLGSAVSISHIVQTADNMQSLASKVRLATSSLDEHKAVQEQLRTISNAQKSSFEGVVDLYSSSHRALSELGKSQQDVINFTENMTMAMNIGGGSAQAQAAALTQLGQALGSGALRGDEFNSVAEQAPILLDLVAKEMGVATGALRGLAAEGAITSDVVYNAVVQATDSLTAMSAKMPTTFSQGVQVIKNEYNYLIDDIMNQNSMLSQNLANTALWIAENFRTLVGVGTAMGAVWLANIAKNSALVTSLGSSKVLAKPCKMSLENGQKKWM
ncbi:tape measure protein [Moraxella bovis]|uniref:tape measure protein n=1 Tax=Moraxella bovis TaxID=476 RepID=UPI002225CD48|nr:tape measure protein [Moraxella bovis]UYZ74104.1 tape measure protein [Moraxella bovis]